jgi:hypothetical protein
MWQFSQIPSAPVGSRRLPSAPVGSRRHCLVDQRAAMWPCRLLAKFGGVRWVITVEHGHQRGASRVVIQKLLNGGKWQAQRVQQVDYQHHTCVRSTR